MWSASRGTNTAIVVVLLGLCISRQRGLVGSFIEQQLALSGYEYDDENDDKPLASMKICAEQKAEESLLLRGTENLGIVVGGSSARSSGGSSRRPKSSAVSSRALIFAASEAGHLDYCHAAVSALIETEREGTLRLRSVTRMSSHSSDRASYVSVGGDAMDDGTGKRRRVTNFDLGQRGRTVRNVADMPQFEDSRSRASSSKFLGKLTGALKMTPPPGLGASPQSSTESTRGSSVASMFKIVEGDDTELCAQMRRVQQLMPLTNAPRILQDLSPDPLVLSALAHVCVQNGEYVTAIQLATVALSFLDLKRPGHMPLPRFHAFCWAATGAAMALFGYGEKEAEGAGEDDAGAEGAARVAGDQYQDAVRGPTHLEDYAEYRKKLKSVVHALCEYGANTKVTRAHCLYMRGWWRLARSYLGKALTDWKALLAGTSSLEGQESSREGTPATVWARARHLVQQLKNMRQKDIAASGRKKKKMKKTTTTAAAAAAAAAVLDRAALLASTLALRPVPVDFRDCEFRFGARAEDVQRRWEVEQAMREAEKAAREREREITAAAAAAAAANAPPDAAGKKAGRVPIEPLPAAATRTTDDAAAIGTKGKAKSMW